MEAGELELASEPVFGKDQDEMRSVVVWVEQLKEREETLW